MMRSLVGLGLSMVLVVAGCGGDDVPGAVGAEAPVVTQPAAPLPRPVLTGVEWSSGPSAGTAEPGRPITLAGGSARLSLLFAGPIDPSSAVVENETRALRVDPDLASSTATRLVLNATASVIGSGTIRVTGLNDAGGHPVPGLPLSIPVTFATPPLTEAERAELARVGLDLWRLAAVGDTAALQGRIAPEEQLSSPGGEFLAPDLGPGLPNVIQWAGQRASASAPQVAVQSRKSYAVYDVIIVDTGSGHFVAFVTIPERKIAKLFGLKNYHDW